MPGRYQSLRGSTRLRQLASSSKPVFPGLPPDKRERIERTLLSIPDTVPTDRREVGERIRNRLLGCLADAEFVTHEARSLLADLQAANSVPPNEPLIQFGGWTGKPYGEEEYLADEGVPVNEEANRRLRDLERPVKEFGDKHLNAIPALEEVAAVFPALQALRIALSRADADGVHPKQQAYAWDCLVRVHAPESLGWRTSHARSR